MNLPAPDTVWASMPVPALIVDPEDRIGDINAAAELFLNISSRAITGTPVFEHATGDGRCPRSARTGHSEPRDTGCANV